jgi:trehalose 6-phosphate phosphatase
MTPDNPKDLPPPPPLAELERPALFLDLDGTLAAIEPRPEDVGPQPWRTRLLLELQDRLDGRLAVVSGRTLEDVDRILEGAAPAVAAVHGLVRRRHDGTLVRTAPHPGLARARQQAAALAARHPGLRIEDKGLSLALHFRFAPDLEPLVLDNARRIAREQGLKLQPGSMVAELTTPGLDKGGAVRAFMAEPPFAGALPVFVGDDVTDEDGFDAVRAEGIGVLAGPARPTRAIRRLDGVDAVREWLSAMLLEGTRG